MGFFAVITFDLKGAESLAYKCVEGKLGKLGIKKYINKTKLPQNVFIGRFDDDRFGRSGELRDYINGKVERIFKKCGVNGPYFIFVGDKWAWKKGITRQT